MERSGPRGVEAGHRDTETPAAGPLAEAALGLYGLGGARTQRLRRGFVGVFRVACPGQGEFCLRMYDLPPPGAAGAPSPPPGRPSAAQLRAQLRWLSALSRETDLAVPGPVPAPDGSLASYVPSGGPDDPGRLCALLRWVPGENRREGLGAPADLSALGSFVAGAHNLAARRAHPEPSALPRWDWHWPFGPSAPLWEEGGRYYTAGEMAVFGEASRRVREDLEGLGHGPDAFGPIHRDLHLGNVVFDGGRAGAVDFDLCGGGHYLLDLAVLLNALRVRFPRRFEGMRGALLAGYERERPLPAGYRGLLMTFHAMRHVARANREIRRAARSGVDRRRGPGPAPAPDVPGWLRSNYLEGRHRRVAPGGRPPRLPAWPRPRRGTT